MVWLCVCHKACVRFDIACELGWEVDDDMLVELLETLEQDDEWDESVSYEKFLKAKGENDICPRNFFYMSQQHSPGTSVGVLRLQQKQQQLGMISVAFTSTPLHCTPRHPTPTQHRSHLRQALLGKCSQLFWREG